LTNPATGNIIYIRTKSKGPPELIPAEGGVKMLNPENLAKGQEQHETFETRKKAVQYDYRHTDGELFSCVKSTLNSCKAARDAWLQKKAVK